MSNFFICGGLEAQAKPHKTKCKAHGFYEGLHVSLLPNALAWGFEWGIYSRNVRVYVCVCHACRGVGVRKRLVSTSHHKTIGIDSIQLYTGYHSAAYIQTS